MKRSSNFPFGQSMIFALINDLLSNGTLTIGHLGRSSRIVPFGLGVSSGSGTAVVSFNLAFIAICASTRRLLQPRAEPMCDGDFPLAQFDDGAARALPSIAATPLRIARKTSHEALNAAETTPGTEHAEQPLNMSWLGAPLLSLRKVRAERLLRLRRKDHVHDLAARTEPRASLSPKSAWTSCSAALPSADRPGAGRHSIQRSEVFPAQCIVRDPVESISAPFPSRRPRLRASS